MKKLTIASLLMTSSLLLSRIIGFVRDATIASTFGSGSQTDAYVAAFTLPDFLNYLVAGGAFSLTFIPIFTAYLVNKDEEKGWKLYSIIISIMTVILVLAIIILEFLAPVIVARMFPGFDAETLERTVLFTRIVLPAQLFFYNGGIISAILLSKKKFLVPALAPVIYNLSIILFGVLLSGYGMIGFAIGALVGAILGPFGIQFMALRKEIQFKLNFNIFDKDFIYFFKKSIPIMLGLILVTLDDWLSKRYGSFLNEGTITYINNSRRLVLVPIGLFAQANAQAILPFLSEFYAKKDVVKFNELAKKSLTLVFFITLFAASWFMLFATEIIQLVYGRGAYTLFDVLSTGSIFFYLSISIPFWASIIIVSRFYYAASDTRTPMIIGVLMTVISLPLYGLLSEHYKAVGIVLTISVIKVLYFFSLLFLYKRRNKGFELKNMLTDLMKILLFFYGITALFYLAKQAIPEGHFLMNNVLFFTLFGSGIQLVLTLYFARFIRLTAYEDFMNKYLRRVLRKFLRFRRKYE